MKWSKIIILWCVVFIISCTKEEIVPIPPKMNTDIFSVSETSISNGDTIMFKLTSDSTYILKLVDKTSNQVISKEKIVGKIGENKLNIYTNSIQSQYLYLILEDVTKNKLGKTTIIIN